MNDKIFEKRAIVCFIVIIFLLFSCILRVTVIANSNYAQVQTNQTSIKIKISNIRGTIFDCNKYPITNREKKIIACISPTPRAVTVISTLLEGQELENVLSALKNGKPVTAQVPKKIECEGIVYTEIFKETEIPAIHTLGYTDNEENGMSGIQKAYNNILTYKEELSIRYACDGMGRILKGVKPETINNISPYSNAVVTTIDINIQNIIEDLSNSLKLGSIVVADAKTAKIRGIVSRPNFSKESISEVLNDNNSPLFNRALGAYNVGSVFKPCIAAAGLESKIDDFSYNCTGSFEIIDRTFNCHKHEGHGFTNLNFGIANSCNTFFYNYAIKIGENKIYNTANNLNFGKKIKICDGIYTANGTLPNLEKLKNIAHLANFSIGQGDFTASPISLLPLYCAIANDGKYYMPSIVESTIMDNVETKYNIGFPTQAFSLETAKKLKDALSLVITEGTGKSANPTTVTAAGKTATAQTGKFENGIEKNSSWFCGFFPREEPKYVVIIFCEDQTKAEKTCSEIFAKTADKIMALQ